MWSLGVTLATSKFFCGKQWLDTGLAVACSSLQLSQKECAIWRVTQLCNNILKKHPTALNPNCKGMRLHTREKKLSVCRASAQQLPAGQSRNKKTKRKYKKRVNWAVGWRKDTFEMMPTGARNHINWLDEGELTVNLWNLQVEPKKLVFSPSNQWTQHVKLKLYSEL